MYMAITTRTISSLDDLKTFIKEGKPALYHASKTSTVIPFDQIEQFYPDKELTLVNLSTLPAVMEMDEDRLMIKGPVTWKEARGFCHEHGRELPMWPTEELACVLSGIATSATGERSFNAGSLRAQVDEVTYLNHRAEEIVLSCQKALDSFEMYDKIQKGFREFKNAPFPYLSMEIDLMIGTEGQLGVITEAVLRTKPLENTEVLFIKVPKWEEDYSLHIKIMNKVQEFRNQFYCVELLDSNSLEFIEKEKRPDAEGDLIFLEYGVKLQDFVFEHFVTPLGLEDQVFVMEAAKFKEFRMEVPRGVQEYNSRNGVVKKGTDVQVRHMDFRKLLDLYRELAKSGIRYLLFGHFGDAHLHFNLLAKTDQVEDCTKLMNEFYDKITDMKCSPFAEHGIGLIKQNYVRPFYTKEHFDTFKKLKDLHDPKRQFFPGGFMEMTP
ncbi:MAG: FAD-binding oxidoreductase [Deltaproteobacteria bacterium]|nr:MAG: FAD-binding oxidoreductase [Deltaproteobacteria bacterium]